ncbi:hypothetical protein M0805_006155 [Coniferiporia weirii]|nr:hypothetical protein M0805_006155 [Coniferiporia weirii]
MDSHLQIPSRLRLSRQSFSPAAATVDDSDSHVDRDTTDDDEDNASTPRVGVTKVSIDSFDGPPDFSALAQAQSTPAVGREETPAARLRALLARVPGSATPTPKASARPRSPSLSMLESDLDVGDFDEDVDDVGGANTNPATPYPNHKYSPSPPGSAAHASLRDLFSRALREPGNTPVRSRGRRGSIGSASTDDSPVKTSAIRIGIRAKRMNLSDDETGKDKLDEKSSRSSQAATYESLRERLVKSNLGASTNTDVSAEDMSVGENGHTNDMIVPLRTSTPPASSSTVLRQSVSQFPSLFIGSNLMDGDSDMQRVIRDIQVDTTASEGSAVDDVETRTPIAGPSSNHVKSKPSIARERTLSRQSSVESIVLTHSRPSSSQGVRAHDPFSDRKRDLERGWNRPLSAYMDRHQMNSPGFGHRRESSEGLYSSSEGGFGRASPAPSVGSQSEHQSPSPKHDQTKRKNASPADFDSEHARSPTVSPAHVRIRARARTMSQPSKPDNPKSLNSSTSSNGTQRPNGRPRTDSLTTRDSPRPPTSLAHVRSASALALNHGHYDRSRSASPTSSKASSRASSRASSHASQELDREHEHLRERNWNSPHLKRIGSADSSPSSRLERSRPGATPSILTPPTERLRRETPSPLSGTGSVPGPKHNRRLSASRHIIPNEKEPRGQEPRETEPLSYTSASSNNFKYSTSSSLTGRHKIQSQIPAHRPEHPPSPRRTWDRANSRSKSPLLPEPDNADELEEHDTPRVGLQRISGPSSPVSGSRSNGRAESSPAFASHIPVKAKERVVKLNSLVSLDTENSRRRRSEEVNERNESKPQRTSIVSDPIFFHESDLDSFHEEDIAASSSTPRVSTEKDPTNDGEIFQGSLSLSGNSNQVLRPHFNGWTENTAVKQASYLPANFSPPPSPPIMPSDPITTTPQRRPVTSSVTNISKMEFQTPSPPKGMPPLPDPPTSSDEGVESDRTAPARTPITPAHKNKYADAKTPRPPGAWNTPFTAPAPSARVNSLLSDRDPEKARAVKQEEMHTPPASYSRATSMTLKTPAPPGAWLATPAMTAAKRQQQKVRFDEEKPLLPSTHEESSLSSNSLSLADGSVITKAIKKTDPSSPRAPRRIRVLDAFGNEIAPTLEENTEKRAHLDVDISNDVAKENRTDFSVARKNRLRILDATGKEIDETKVTSVSFERGLPPTQSEQEGVSSFFQELEDKNLEHKQALELLQKTIAELKNDFNRTDDPADPPAPDAVDAKIEDLKARSIRAKEQRERLLTKIQILKTDDPPSQSISLANAANLRKYASTRRSCSIVFWALVIQIFIFVSFYRLISMGARRLFLTTYIDPFYPELHLHITNPNLLRLSGPEHGRSDLYDTGTQTEWIRLLGAIWQELVERICSLREGVWDIWRDPPRDVTWPPT